MGKLLNFVLGKADAEIFWLSKGKLVFSMFASIPDTNNIKSRLAAPRPVERFGIDTVALARKLGLDQFDKETDELYMGYPTRAVCAIDSLPLSDNAIK